MQTSRRLPESPDSRGTNTTSEGKELLRTDPEELESASSEQLEEKRAALVEELNVIESYLAGFYYDLVDPHEEEDEHKWLEN